MSRALALAILLISSAAVAEPSPPSSSDNACVPAATGAIPLTAPVTLFALVSWAHVAFCHPIVVPPWISLSQEIPGTLSNASLTIEKQQEEYLSALGRAHLANSVHDKRASNALWTITSALAPAKARADCVPLKPRASFRFDLAGAENVESLAKLLETLTCRSVMYSPRLALRGVSLFASRASTTAEAAERIVRGALVASGIAVTEVPVNGERTLVLTALTETTTPTPPRAGAPPVGNHVRCVRERECVIDRSYIDQLLANPMALMSSARIVPNFKDGKVNGLRLFGIRADSLFGTIGFLNGDTLQTINGMSVDAPEQALAVYSKLRDATELVIVVERRGTPTTLKLTIH